MTDIVAIMISVDYEDILPYVLEANHTFFKHWYIVTEERDLVTQEMCKKYPNVEVLFFKFKDEKSEFNFGGARKYAQQIANEEFKDDYKLIIDSDICLPSNFKALVNTINIDEDTIYGTERRLVMKIEDYLNNTVSHCVVETHLKPQNRVIGFFQLYRSSFLYEDSTTCGHTDILFSNKFKKVKYLDMIVIHLGQIGQNWGGRITQKISVDQTKIKYK